MNRRVLVVGDMSKGALAESYARGFEQIGLQVFRFDSEQAMRRASGLSRNRVTRRLARRYLWHVLNREVMEVARSLGPQLLFTVKGSFLDPETIRLIRKTSCAHFVNCYPDNPYIGVRLDPRETSALRRDLIDALREYSAVLMWETNLTGRLRTDGVIAEYVPFGVDRELFAAGSAFESSQCLFCSGQHEVAFVGTNSRARRGEISAIRKHSVAIWGNNWPTTWKPPSAHHHVHHAVWGSAVSQIYARAPVSLNVLNAESLDGHNMRTFEIPASGGIMLARFTQAQNELFPEGEAAMYYRTPGEIDDKIDSILSDCHLRDRLRRNAVIIAADHSYDRRAEAIWRETFRQDDRRAA
jgi:hypothetical protein